MNKWQIKDLKGVGDVELSLDSNQRVFTFLGTNGVGKTNMLLSLLYYFLINTREFPLRIDSKDIRGSFVANFISCDDIVASSLFENGKEFVYDDEWIQYYSTETDEELLYLEQRGCYKSKKIPYDTIAYIPAGLARISNYPITEMKIKDSNENSIESLYSQLLHYTFLGNTKGYGVNVRNWFVEMAFLSNPYQKNSNIAKNALSAIITSLNSIDNRIDKNFLSLDGSNVFLKIDGQKREISTLSSGFLYIFRLVQKIISSYALLGKDDIFNIKGVVLIDEIESHLHLEWQVKIIPILKNLFPNTTFYITTHSPLVLSQLNEGEAYLLKRDDDNVVRSHLINSPNTRLLENVLQDAFGVNLNELKRQNMANIDQSKAKKKLLDLLNSQVSQ